ncbi:hypothetical protein AYI70_g9181 [Smittium culicis]|uniref:Uncharacterized protein n=1 Tax=Smittium culicis TaxID=133412 RepID=A0A1R1XCI9_9FUNG|nr:hypothetical protein AYI70_g9181 [Smittium culicis]
MLVIFSQLPPSRSRLVSHLPQGPCYYAYYLVLWLFMPILLSGRTPGSSPDPQKQVTTTYLNYGLFTEVSLAKSSM